MDKLLKLNLIPLYHNDSLTNPDKAGIPPPLRPPPRKGTHAPPTGNSPHCCVGQMPQIVATPPLEPLIRKENSEWGLLTRRVLCSCHHYFQPPPPNKGRKWPNNSFCGRNFNLLPFCLFLQKKSARPKNGHTLLPQAFTSQFRYGLGSRYSQINTMAAKPLSNFGVQNFHLNHCYFHQDPHYRLLQPASQRAFAANLHAFLHNSSKLIDLCK